MLPLDANASHGSNASTEARRILLVEDDEVLLKTEFRVLRDAGYVVETALNGEEGWKALNSSRYDLLITDHLMPLLSGMELIWRMHDAGLTLPVIMISGLSCVEVINPSPEPAAWFNAFLEKPVEAHQLIDAVREVLGESHVSRAARAGRRATRR